MGRTRLARTVVMVNTPARVQYHPNGYPELGLAPTTQTFRYRKDSDLRRLRARLERWERRQGNLSFEARNLHKMPVELAFELVNVYVAMRELFPLVRPDFIDFAGTEDRDTLATATNYSDNMPTVRDLVSSYEDIDPVDADMLIDIARGEYADARVIRALRIETTMMAAGAVRDPSATGSIEFGDVFRKKRSYQKLLAFWEVRNQRALSRGLPPRVLPAAVSAASFTMIHEFGHLVEAELHEAGYKPTERVYRVLSELILGVVKPNDRQWRYHLVNYPTYDFTTCKGPAEGGSVRRKETKKALHLPIREKLGTYASTCRDELFAEAFAHTYGGTHRMRRDMAPFKAELKRRGIGVQRRASRY